MHLMNFILLLILKALSEFKKKMYVNSAGDE